ncbi:DNA-binding transcriptional regulator YdaS (Cro superfamily) [Natronocella acetinitrilica]|uniref:DNA-binding transcriptional regulator YdaS (Cro superfamily) n=1 Tax=Natronocella acetinitrilica TaxID=414046 RepID=A0AAE3G804_9GAMM|nr:YdaS family helix-turn-helix protein [Natronocella acetinitrilica]MCP1675477.1 DNA-binding transcriptional regulator YdaS (Cro superfamily) [Natronocella acetinitrilica]
MYAIKHYWGNLSPVEKKDLASKCETSVAYLSQVFNGHRQAGPRFAQRLARESGGSVTAAQLRPDLADLFAEDAA